MKIEKLYKEQWIPIQGFEDSYAVSSHGRIKSLARTRPFGPRFKTYPEVLKRSVRKPTKDWVPTLTTMCLFQDQLMGKHLPDSTLLPVLWLNISILKSGTLI